MKNPFKRHSPPVIPDDGEYREEATREQLSREYESQQLKSETMPLAQNLEWHLKRNHLAEKIARTYQLRESK